MPVENSQLPPAKGRMLNEGFSSDSNTCQVVIIADKYGLSTLRDHALKELIDISKRNLPEWFQSNAFAATCIHLVRMVWQTRLDCFATAKIVMLEELAKALEHISERPEFQQLLADKKDLSLELLKGLSKRANLFTRFPSVQILRSCWPTSRTSVSI